MGSLGDESRVSNDGEQFFARTIQAWRRWLVANHTRANGVWLVSYKQVSGKARYDYNAAVEEALAFGWIDSKPRALDDERTMLWFAPRKPRTGWSAPNKERVARLIADGRMTPAGQAKVDAAKADGSWTKLDAVEALEVPRDLAAALGAHPPAAEHFAAFPRSVKRGILEWIANAKQAETRQRRVMETATLAAKNHRANQWRPR
jgi:uncharacterized protein YdeI (YjbR/CyaY-like superfamily)